MYNPLDLTGSTILVTGASSGIGRACAVMCARLGARVVLMARNRERLEETRSRMEGPDHCVLAGDLTAEGFISAAAERLSGQGLVFDGFVHAAGVFSMAPLRLLDPKIVHEVMAVNFYAFLELSRCFVRQKGLSGGSAVGISSVAALAGSSALAVYGASKGALESSVRALAREYSHRQIRFNSIVASYIETPMADQVRQTVGEEAWARQISSRQPMGMGSPDDIAHAAVFLLSRSARFITGSALAVDGGYLS